MSTELPTAPHLPADTAVCDACQHADARHDSISRRYCAATTAGGVTRDCICAGQA